MATRHGRPAGLAAMLLAGALLAGVLLAGCGSSGSGTPRRPSPSPSVSVGSPGPGTSTRTTPTPTPVGTAIPADVPMTGPNLNFVGETPPVMPAAALAHTQEGAVAFAQFFIQTMDWGYASVSSTYMRHYFTDACTICAGLADAIDRIGQQHYHVAGNRFTLSAPSIRSVDAFPGAQVTVDVRVAVSSAEVVNDSGLFVQGQPALNLIEHLGVSFGSDGWMVVAMGATR